MFCENKEEDYFSCTVSYKMCTGIYRVHGSKFGFFFSIEGEYVPKTGDEVTYKVILIPPKMEKRQAVHVKITHLAPGVSHEKWDSTPDLETH